MAGEPTNVIVPIFPLRTVLFPGMPLVLFIFEQRYRTMLADIGAADSRFCVSLIKEGPEVGGFATPHTTGCLAEIEHVQASPEGTFFVLARGVARVRLVSTDAISKPYLTGEVSLWSDVDGDPPDPALLTRAGEVFDLYARCLHGRMGKQHEPPFLPEQPDLLSYLLAMNLRVDATESQRLLEIPDTSARLKLEVARMLEEIPLLRSMKAVPGPPVRRSGHFSRN